MRPIELLLIEDNAADARLTAETLREVSVPSRLAVVNDGVEAMAFLRQERQYADAPVPDLIVMDLQLPRMSGLEILDELQADSRLRQIPVVVLTGSVDLDERAELMKQSIQRHIIKPCDLDSYIACIRSLLNEFHPRS